MERKNTSDYSRLKQTKRAINKAIHKTCLDPKGKKKKRKYLGMNCHNACILLSNGRAQRNRERKSRAGRE